jgi:hypothetical protein
MGREFYFPADVVSELPLGECGQVFRASSHVFKMYLTGEDRKM